MKKAPEFPPADDVFPRPLDPASRRGRRDPDSSERLPFFQGPIGEWKCQQACRGCRIDSEDAFKISIDCRKLGELFGNPLPTDAGFLQAGGPGAERGDRGLGFRVLFEKVDRLVEMGIFLLPLPSQFQRCLRFFDRSSGTFFDL